MLSPRVRRLSQAAALLLLSPALIGCSRTRAAKSSPSLPPISIGQPAAGALLAEARPANVVICVLDAARADHVGCYGYPRATTPNLDRLARECVVFKNHFATCSATEPSTASLLTGLYPDTHRLPERKEIAPGALTLEKGLQAAGLRTALLTSNLVASPECGIGADFQDILPTWISRRRPEKPRAKMPEDEQWRTPEGLTRTFADWLDGVRSSRFFAYLHFLPPHTPYAAPEALTNLFAAGNPPPAQVRGFEFPQIAPSYGLRYPPRQWANLYDANLRWADWGVGEVVQALRDRDLLDSTLLIVTSDHGEAFGEHGYLFHALAVYDEFVHIPLLIRFPGPRRLVGQVDALTQTVDVLPTVLDLVRASYAQACPEPSERDRVQGKSLRPLLEGRQRAVREYVFARSGGNWPQYLVRDAQWSLLRYRGGQLKALYDLRNDPAQACNVAAAHPETAAKMTAALKTFGRTQARSVAEFVSPGAAPAPASRAANRPLSPRARQELKALGYLE